MTKAKEFPTGAFPKGIELGTIAPDAYYQLEMLMPHKVGRVMFNPLNKYKVKGYVLSEIPEFKIKSAEII